MKKKKKPYNSEFLDNFNKMYTILGNLFTLFPKGSNLLTEEEFNQLLYICNTKNLNFPPYSPTAIKNIRVSKINSVYNIVFQNYKQPIINFVTLIGHNRKGETGVFIAHQIFK